MSSPSVHTSRCQTLLTLSQSLQNITEVRRDGALSEVDFKLLLEVINEEFKLVRKYQKLNDISINKSLVDNL